MANTSNFSFKLQKKIDFYSKYKSLTSLGKITSKSKLVLAPMANITHLPFRLLMSQLGAGLGVSELISAKGIIYNSEKTIHMLQTSPNETTVGIQLFGDEAESLSKACESLNKHTRYDFVDINMGCPVNKVTKKGGGAALMRRPEDLLELFKSMKAKLDVPLTIKIRTGWDADSINAKEIIDLAKEANIEFVSIHGRTRAQAYTGFANWELLEDLASDSSLPIIGNGDLATVNIVQERLAQTNCKALMIGRGALRNPFIFLESLLTKEDSQNLDQDLSFDCYDYLELINIFANYLSNYFKDDRKVSIQLKKQLVWWAHGYHMASKFRDQIFKEHDINQILKFGKDYFTYLAKENYFKRLDSDQSFLSSGHG